MDMLLKLLHNYNRKENNTIEKGLATQVVSVTKDTMYTQIIITHHLTFSSNYTQLISMHVEQ